MMSKGKYNKSALSVSKGVKQPPSVNPNLQKKQKHPLTTDEYVRGLLQGDRTVLGRCITLVESNLQEHSDMAQEIIAACLPYTGNSIRIGITGVPGVGKSSFIETFGSNLTRNGNKLAVLAIDPSSERSKGSILGDKTRMESLATDENAFIRPSPSAGTLGGVARKTRESILLCEAAGYNVIIVETVGVGQSETAVHSMVDFFLLLMLAGAGDELQGIKRGIMEMADMLVITKSDGSNIDNATRAASQYKSALHLFPMPESKWLTQVLTCSAREISGIEIIWEEICRYKDHALNNGFYSERRKKQALYWMDETIRENLRNHFYRREDINVLLENLRSDVLNDKISSFVAAQQVLNYYFNNNN
jgi:LAO/AO transport system kinase